MFCRRANSISSSVLPTPAKTHCARVAARRDDAPQFAGADDVEAAAEIGQRPQDGEVGIRLSWRNKSRWSSGARARLEFLKMIRQRALRIDVKRRAEFFGERVDGDAFAKQIFADVTKIVHRRECKGRGGKFQHPSASKSQGVPAARRHAAPTGYRSEAFLPSSV